MDDKTANDIESDLPGVIIIDSKANGLKYLIDDIPNRIVIGGKKGLVMLSMKQARALRDEISDIIDMKANFTARERNRK